MYSMPIVGTNANLYFPSERSQDPMVIGCVRKNGSSYEKFSDVNNRYFATESGNNLDMLPDAINLSRPGLSATFNDGGGVNLSSSSTLSVNAGTVGLFAGNVTIQGRSKVVAEKGGNFISLENDFYDNASIIKENGRDRTSNTPFDDDPQKGVAEVKAAQEAAIKAELDKISAAIQGMCGDVCNCIPVGSENQTEEKTETISDTNNKKNEMPKEPERTPLEKLWDAVTFSKPCAAAERDDGSYANSKDDIKSSIESTSCDNSQEDLESLPEFTDVNIDPQFYNAGNDGIRANYECNDGTIITGRVVSSTQFEPTFLPDNESEDIEHNSIFSKSVFNDLANGGKAAINKQVNDIQDVLFSPVILFGGWDSYIEDYNRRQEEVRQYTEQLRNSSTSKKVFDDGNWCVDKTIDAYFLGEGIKSAPKLLKNAKNFGNTGKMLIKNPPKSFEELHRILIDILNGNKIVNTEASVVEDGKEVLEASKGASSPISDAIKKIQKIKRIIF